MDSGLATALTILAYTCIIIFILLTVFITMLLVNCIDLIKSYTRLSETVQREINPTLEEIKKALQGVNALATGVDKQLTAVKSSFSNAYNIAFNATSKLKGMSVALIGGLFTGLKFLLKNKK